MLWVLWLACGADPGQAPSRAEVSTTPPPIETNTVDPTAGSQPARGDDGLVEAPGVELVRAHCSACHTTRLVQHNRMSRERWDATLTWMQTTQGLWEIAPEQRGAILDYLATWQGPEHHTAEAASTSPWASPRYEPNPIW